MTDDGHTVTLTQAELDWLMEQTGRLSQIVPDGQPRNWFMQPQKQADGDTPTP